MSIFTKLRDRLSGKAEQMAREQVIQESANLVEYIMDAVGWDAIQNNGQYSVRRNNSSNKNTVAFNLNKYDIDGYIKRGINLHTDFTFGRGIDVPKCKSEVIQDEVINRFWWSSVNQRNYFSFIAQQRRHKETWISGEFNVLIKIDEASGMLKMYPINAHDIEEVIPDPDDQNRAAFFLISRKKKTWNFQLNEWEHGNGKERTLHRAMRYRLFEASDDELRRGLVYHVGMNEFFELLRGYSDIQTIFDSADSARDMADDGTALSRANAETAYKTIIKKGGKTVKDAYLAFVKTKTDGSNPAGAPASDWVENDALSRDWVTARDTGSSYRKEDIRAQRAYVWAGMGFGEHYMGDASTGNLATATAMELPVLKMIQAEQKLWASIYTDLCDFAIDVAVVTGKIDGKIIDNDELEIETTESRTFAVNFPPILQQDAAQIVNAISIGLNNGLITDQTAARIVNELFEVEDIDEALEELFGSKGVDAEIERIRQQMIDKQQTETPETIDTPEIPAPTSESPEVQ